MRYIGSKLRLVDLIKATVKKYCGEDLSTKVFCDLFAGTGVVGANFSPMVASVIANDFELYSYIANHVQLYGYDEAAVADVLKTLNCLEGTESGSLFNAYADGGSYKRMYFTRSNGAKLQAASDYLSKIGESLCFNDFFAVLFSIIDAADKVANTMATYGAYAKTFKEAALKPIEFKLPAIAKKTGGENVVCRCDANKLIKQIKGDILYLDPPYNARQYGSNYHVLNSIALGYAPEADTVTGLDGNYNKSDYCRKNTVGKALDTLIKDANFEWIFLSYNNEGLLEFSKVREIMEKYGDYFVESTEYQRYKADNNRNQAADKTTEYIHVLHKGTFTPKVEEPAEDKPQVLRVKKISLNADFSGSSIDDSGCVYSEEAINNAVEQFNESLKSEEPLIGEVMHPEGPVPVVKAKTVALHNVVTSPMNYMGGKKKLLPYLLPCFPESSNFLDLFCGGATVGINAHSNYIWFNDVIEPLIDMYKFMAENSVEDCLHYIDFVIGTWGLTQENEEAYYNFRESYNNTPVEERNPLDLFVLMAFSFNNQIRFNEKKMSFNIPFGKNRSSFNSKMRENLIGFINALHEKQCVFTSYDFRDINMGSVLGFDDPENTFVYADPPYLVSQATYNSTWDENTEQQLLDYLETLDKQGYKFALSNVLENKGQRNTILEAWVNKNNYNVIHIEKSYANSYYQRKNKETVTDEVLITNYE